MALKRIPAPVRVHLAEDGKQIVIDWQDGLVTEFLAFDLRAECPCAGCVDEMSGRRTLKRGDVDPGIAAVAHGRVGRYALQFQWSDGHTTGIYTYERLRDQSSWDQSRPGKRT
jgi:DUF971 family protein